MGTPSRPRELHVAVEEEKEGGGTPHPFLPYETKLSSGNKLPRTELPPGILLESLLDHLGKVSLPVSIPMSSDLFNMKKASQTLSLPRKGQGGWE